MAKSDIQKLLDDASRSLESEHVAQVESIKTELKQCKTKTLGKISKSIP